MSVMQVIGIVAGICTSAAMIPQIITTIKEKNVEGISILMYVIMLTGNALWIYYGIHQKDIPIIATNILAFLLNASMIGLKIKFK